MIVQGRIGLSGSAQIFFFNRPIGANLGFKCADRSITKKILTGHLGNRTGIRPGQSGAVAKAIMMKAPREI